MIYLTKQQYKTIIEHTKKEYPKESCGILSGKIIDEKEFLVEDVYLMQNVSEQPEICYFMDPKEQLKVLKEIRNKNQQMVAIFHSHTNTEAYPSKRDVSMAYYQEVAYIIVSLQNKENPTMRAFRIIEEKISEIDVKIRKNILYVCVENSCRSQIAEALTNTFYFRKFLAYSAGSKPKGIVNPLALEVLKEIGADITKLKSKGFQDLEQNIEFDYVVTMGCGDVCPTFVQGSVFNVQQVEWRIPDPKDKPIEVFREVLNQIKQNIEKLAKKV
jgi:protein-tyrosine-phosphatase/proteasome lid subunit RPN8/RPN11